jgi:hypothetical protein
MTLEPVVYDTLMIPQLQGRHGGAIMPGEPIPDLQELVIHRRLQTTRIIRDAGRATPFRRPPPNEAALNLDSLKRLGPLVQFIPVQGVPRAQVGVPATPGIDSEVWHALHTDVDAAVDASLRKHGLVGVGTAMADER